MFFFLLFYFKIGSGLAYDKNCPLNYLQSETINLKFPSGTYPGYVLNIPNKVQSIYIYNSLFSIENIFISILTI